MHQLSTAQSPGTVPVPTQFDQAILTHAGTSTLLVGRVTHPPPEEKGGTFSVDELCAVRFRIKTDNCVGRGRSACEEQIDANTRRCSRCDLWKSERSAANARKEEVVSNAANAEKGKMRLEAIIADPTPYTKNKREAGFTSNSFGFPLPSQETPVRPLLRQHFTIPGPALE
eukprot:1233598-Pyramimonas_sp.AAC.1